MIDAITSLSPVEAVGLLVIGWPFWELMTVGSSRTVRVGEDGRSQSPISLYDWWSLRRYRRRRDDGGESQR